MNRFKILDLICLFCFIGLFILFMYSLYIKEYMQSIMCIVFSIIPFYGVVLGVKKQNKKI